ncbi:peptidase inhibitor family I36 protein [Streptomyces sp. BE133]|uniref:peptidase inhibitor family I36 protein n=1 Tax=Streptomyces sp. BE133 TaxID=3002523 RepID=UPI002E79832C|nr:peptidase inhibitor family I36 protein [Streptomyces sp. BE133]MEE1809072.1 peptidase inhibitor family I36 protein [Streptomyces sp. BE133]
MTWKNRTATAASALLLAAGGMLASASPAAADGPCPANRLCVYDQSSFAGNRIASASTNSCFFPQDFTFGSIVSYDNNLSVDAKVWHYYANTNSYSVARTLVAGGFSSNIGIPDLGVAYGDLVCMGNARP